MEQPKSKVSYSIIRYIPDYIKGEIINVGLLLYDYTKRSTKHFILDERSSKVRAIFENDVESDMYKSSKEILEYYLSESREEISGVVGDLYIASYHEPDFLDKVYRHYKDDNLRLSEPNIAFTKDTDKLFNTILNRYVGRMNVDTDKISTLTAKKYMKKIFDSSEKLKSRIKSDVVLKPIAEVSDLEIKVDFTFKNGTWNYMQAIPRVVQHNKNLDWYSKVELMLNCDEARGAKVHLLYKKSDIVQDLATYNLLVYLSKKYANVDLHDVDKERDVRQLCKYIEDEAEELKVV